ncbi:hypothetical protein H1W83_11675 [Priestia megaterium]|uniref:hypothetical protein n=1 Tax=Priestia megaterium TaxID=1404 RepID=UPI001EDC25B8|nr:hypothetical protein [Priestia megaterium]UKJ82885.1 hypothetical protein H1W83_11675 [Priestia megaterium]
MKYSDLISMLSDNMHPEYWVKSVNKDILYTYTLRDNISITIEEMPEREDNQISNEFTEKFMNKTASYHYYVLKYNGASVKNICLYMVDGGRALIPSPPGLADQHVDNDDLILGVIIDRMVFDTRYEYEDTTKFLNRSGLEYQKSVVK